MSLHPDIDSITDRFPYQRNATAHALATTQGFVLNIGCKEDPVPLKPLDPVRVINCDISDFDHIEEKPNDVDVLFDCARDPWPFDNGSATLVVMGDILEHLETDELQPALREARRVGRMLCVTTPSDPDAGGSKDRPADDYRGERHRTFFTEASLRRHLTAADWKIVHFRTVGYGFVSKGFLATCVR